MKISGIDGKEYTIEPEASLRDANLEWANLSGLFGMMILSFQKDLRFLK